MSLWHDILVALLLIAAAATIVGLLCAALLHVRFEAGWFGMWTGSTELPHESFLQIEYGFPGFMRTWKALPPAPSPDDASAHREPPEDSRTQAQPVQGEGGEPGAAHAENAGDAAPAGAAPGAQARPPADTLAGGPERGTGGAEETLRSGSRASGRREPRAPQAAARAPGRARRRHSDRHRHRRALFRLVTDGAAWKLASGYFLRVAARAFRLPGLHVDLSAGHPDPAWLGRFAGRWYAVTPFLPADRARMHFRFEDRHPSFGIRARGGFSLLAFLWFLVVNVLTFPWLRLGRRAWWIWRHGTLAGWRAWTYRKIQTL